MKKTKGGGKEKGKKQKASSENKKNFSIKPPPTSRVRDSKTKTGFNSKKLKFEPGRRRCPCVIECFILQLTTHI